MGIHICKVREVDLTKQSIAFDTEKRRIDTNTILLKNSMII